MARRSRLYKLSASGCCCILLPAMILLGSVVVHGIDTDILSETLPDSVISAESIFQPTANAIDSEPETIIDQYQLQFEEAFELLRKLQSDIVNNAKRTSTSTQLTSTESMEDSTAYLEHTSSTPKVDDIESDSAVVPSTSESMLSSTSTSTSPTTPTDVSEPYSFAGTRKPLGDAVKLLEDAAEHGNADAMYLLGDMSFYGNYTFPRNFTRAIKYYKSLSDLTGNATAQNILGFIYATGMFGDVPRDQARALMYHTFAAYGGDTRSEMTLAFRYHAGIGTPRNCEKAVFFYKRVADKAIQYWKNGPPGGRTLDRHTWKLADDNGGVYGEGASESSSGPNSKKRYSPASDSASLDDVLEYLRYKAEKSDIAAQYSLARLYYDGTRSLPRNYNRALQYFTAVARQYWANDGSPIAGAPKSPTHYGAKAAGYLGRMYLRGEGTAPDQAKSLQWYKLGVEQNDPASLNGLGYMHLKGWGVAKSTAKAAEYFRAAAELDFGPAQVNIGKLFLEQGDVTVAIHYFDLAARHGHIEAYYYLAETHHQALGRERSCGMATVLYKIVAEKVEDLQCPLAWANRMYEVGDYESALIGFMMAAEQGYESGQANVAYLLDQDKSALNLAKPFEKLVNFFDRPSEEDIKEAKRLEELDSFIDEVALMYWTRASKQSNVDATVKMGDYYLKGIGCESDNEKAAACYQAAAEYQQSALALWNLGWMHENGLGVEQDFHLAKRFYDLALTTNSEAYLPVTLSLYKLRLRSFWNSITGGSVNGIGVDEADEKVDEKKWSFTEFWKRWFDDFENEGYDNNGATDIGEAGEDAEPDEGGGNLQI